ncbi:MAG: Spy/CpxP family protein refolding chaperone [Armatimonadota bacterium]
MRTRAIVAIALAIALGVGAWAVTGYLARDTHRHQRMLQAGTLAEKLDLTATQREAIEAVNIEFQREREEIRDRHREHRWELVDLLRESPPDRERIDGKVEEIGELQTQMQRLAVAHLLDVSAELDEQQRDRLFELIDEAMCPGSVMGGTGRDC